MVHLQNIIFVVLLKLIIFNIKEMLNIYSNHLSNKINFLILKILILGKEEGEVLKVKEKKQLFLVKQRLRQINTVFVLYSNNFI